MAIGNQLKKFVLKRFFPFKDWITDLRNPKILRADIVAGLTVALVLVPQSMAYAQLAGLPPCYGLYASFLPVAIASIFGSCLLYTSPSPRDVEESRMPSSA